MLVPEAYPPPIDHDAILEEGHTGGIYVYTLIWGEISPIYIILFSYIFCCRIFLLYFP